jgi:hypothetical protein
VHKDIYCSCTGVTHLQIQVKVPGTKGLFVSVSQLAFSAEKLRSQKQKQTTNFSTDFWNAKKQASEEMN